ncbi:DUF1573 domain-containing protein [Flavobacterium pectinovorum]|uniref:DUF1573 domain-containing protein n=1 Tax=Flavobacterium pectinovorum TaxID=29533 RepID=A0AB36NVT1_9FLAO|nr:DUF1573 domain-containing protein [Flavobacterium pectinovorum]OXB00004.1 hypothetical protein B0A72_20720 [Flavobacterium pectinovorum]SHM51839.1 Protein of unknown function [Flavobacterium pectinovorum]
MKIIKISMLALALGLMSFSAIAPVQSLVYTNENSTIAASTILWKAETVDVGEIPQGTPKAIVYEFKNTGKTAVVITNVKGSCGCTATDYTKEPILPGKSAKVTATYNAANKGAFTKTVTVTTSAEETPKILTLKGTVI